MDRRHLKTRSAAWAQKSAAIVASSGISPNQISLLSVVFAAALIPLGYASRSAPGYMALAALFIQMRLLCNMLDGMVAVEHQKSSPTGDLYNDVPDRFADILILMGASLAIPDRGFAVEAIHLGWAASVVAALTAYVRVLGKSLGAKTYFIGPMAKQHRMFFVTLAFIAEFFLAGGRFAGLVMYSTLILISLGALAGFFRRLVLVAKDLNAGAGL